MFDFLYNHSHFKVEGLKASGVEESDIDNMIDASKEYMKMSDNSNSDNLSSSRLDTIIDMIRGLKEEMTTGSTPGTAGFSSKAPAKGPTAGYDKVLGKKKRKPTPVGRYGSRKLWLQDLKKNGK